MLFFPKPIAIFTVAATCVSLSAKPEVVQEINGLERPTVAVFSPDKRTLMVANFARSEVGAIKDASFISKYRVDAEGRLSLSSKRFIDGLTAPMDMAYAPVTYGSVPAGSIFVAMGTPLVENNEGRLSKNPSRELIGLSVFNPSNGRLLKNIELGPTSENKLREGMPLVSPSSLVFDRSGNLYLTDSGIGGNLFPGKVRGRPGIWMIEASGVIDLLNGSSPKNSKFIPISSMPGPMRYVEKDDVLYITANHNVGVPKGNVFKIACTEFKTKGLSSLQTVVRDLNSLSGIQISPKSGRIILTTTAGDIVFPKGRKHFGYIRIRPRTRFSSPGNYGMIALEDGSLRLAIPEIASNHQETGTQTLKVVHLDGGY